jgi:hypothetical protein
VVGNREIHSVSVAGVYAEGVFVSAETSTKSGCAKKSDLYRIPTSADLAAQRIIGVPFEESQRISWQASDGSAFLERISSGRPIYADRFEIAYADTEKPGEHLRFNDKNYALGERVDLEGHVVQAVANHSREEMARLIIIERKTMQVLDVDVATLINSDKGRCSVVALERIGRDRALAVIEHYAQNYLGGKRLPITTLAVIDTNGKLKGYQAFSGMAIRSEVVGDKILTLVCRKTKYDCYDSKGYGDDFPSIGMDVPKDYDFFLHNAGSLELIGALKYEFRKWGVPPDHQCIDKLVDFFSLRGDGLANRVLFCHEDSLTQRQIPAEEGFPLEFVQELTTAGRDFCVSPGEREMYCASLGWYHLGKTALLAGCHRCDKKDTTHLIWFNPRTHREVYRKLFLRKDTEDLTPSAFLYHKGAATVHEPNNDVVTVFRF